MWSKRVFTRFIILFLLVALAFAINYCARAFPIISGYGAKVMCSGVFLAGRDENKVREEELGFFPIKFGHYSVNYTDSSVTGTIFGIAKQKAIYRTGLGATLISEITEDSFRKQSFRIAPLPMTKQDSLRWPMGNLTDESFPQKIDSEKLYTAVHNAFVEKDIARPVRTRAILVLFDGQLIAEEYANGFTSRSRLQGWSMTKSVVSSLIGILVNQSRLQIDSSAPVREWSDPSDPRHSITVRDLLQQSSGLDFIENYSKASDATVMLYERADMGGFTAKHKLDQLPGSYFYYSSGNTNILSRMIRQITGDSLYYAFPYTQLFYRIGMQSAVMEPDASGSFVGSSYMYATARDWARFGLLYENDGVWLGERILPANWVKETSTPAPGASEGEYGFQFWLNAGDKEGNRKYPHAPEDMYCADGFESQFIFIIPSKKMVIVRLGLTQHHNFDADHFLQEILASFR
jgi:CubicO group peptidase (beta-lactamase class C family)